MPAIAATRHELSDRFEVLGFTVKTGDKPYFEVAIATDPALFRPDQKSKRTTANFYSTRAIGPLAAERGEAVVILPPEVAPRFVGQSRLFYALATFTDANRSRPEILRLPTEDSPWINLSAYSGRARRRNASFRTSRRGNLGDNYGVPRPQELEWAGDAARPGTEAVAPMTPAPARSTTPTAQSGDIAYDDGYGPLAPDLDVVPASIDPESLEGGDTSRIEGACEEASAPTTASFAIDIPLDPGAGGRTIDEGDLEMGDIIVSTTAEFVSRAIQAATKGPVSHSMVYTGDGGQVVEAIGDGVVFRPLSQALRSATVAVAFRFPGLTEDQRLRIRDFVGNQIGKNYNYWGLVNQARFTINSAYCDLLAGDAREACRRFNGRIYLGSGSNDSFFCSQLVLAAYRAADIELTSTPPHWSTPTDIANLRLRHTLNYVGHLRTPSLAKAKSIEVDGVAQGAEFGEVPAPTSLEPSFTVADTLALSGFSAAAVQRMAETFRANKQSATPRNCIAITNAGLQQLFGSVLRSPGGTTIQGLMGGLERTGLAQAPIVFEFNDASGRLTRGVRRPERLRASIEDWMLTEAERNGQAGWYVFGMSVMDGYHSVVLGLAFSGRGNPSTRIYWGDQIYSGWENVTGSLDAHLIQLTQRWWDPLPQNRKARTRVTVWPLTPGVSATAHTTADEGEEPTSNELAAAEGSALAVPGEVVPNYRQATSAAQAAAMYSDWLRRGLRFQLGVHSTAFFPHSGICKIYGLDAQGRRVNQGSGFYVGRNKVVTAAHVVWRTNGMRVNGVEVIPGLHGTQMPYNGATVSSSAFTIHSGYNPAKYNANTDIAVIKNAPDAPHGQFFTMQELRMSPVTGIITCGYASEGTDPTIQHLDVDAPREVTGDTFTYAAQVRRGSSGGPVFYTLNAQTIRVVGVNILTADAHTNRGLRLTDALIAWINAV